MVSDPTQRCACQGKTVLRLWDHFPCLAAVNGHTSCRRVLHESEFAFSDRTWCRAGQGNTVLRLWDHFASFAAINGHTSCLRVLHEFGFKFSSHAWDMAAQAGHVDCLAFAFSNAYAPEDSALEGAVTYGQLPCVEFLLQQGLPRKPYLHCGSCCTLSPEHMRLIQQGSPPKPYMHNDDAPNFPAFEPAMLDSGLQFMEFLLKHAMPGRAYVHSEHRGVLGTEQMKCMRLIAESGVAINPQTLIEAARQGDLDFVRLLHGHGVPLWDLVLVEPPNLPSWGYVHEEPRERVALPWPPGYATRPRTLIFYNYYPPYQLEDFWTVLRYGSVCGAPVTREMQELLEEKRRRTRTLLLCAKAAARLTSGPGSSQFKAARQLGPGLVLYSWKPPRD